MLESLTSDAWAFIMLGVAVTAAFYAWAADAILGRIGFGVILTTIIAEGGGYGGLYATDWAIQHHQLPPGYETPQVYLAGSMMTVTLLLLLLCTLKRIFWR